MGMSTSISRFLDYYRQHGAAATCCRIGLALKRGVFTGRSLLFYCDLSTQPKSGAALPSFLSVERKQGISEIAPADLEQMATFWNPKLAYRNMRERFTQGASLWLIKREAQLAGFGWTLQGRTIEPHYFPLGPNDVQFLDFHVFPKYRGRAIDGLLITYIIQMLAADGLARAFGEAAEWNKASISSFGMSPFRVLGCAKKTTVFGCTIVRWFESDGVLEKQARKQHKKGPVRAKKTSYASQ
jgi:ribosomal protein S18 acetylase RimI-like enzyme